MSSNTKCPECGLVNFAGAEKCKRCEQSLAGAQTVSTEVPQAEAPPVAPPILAPPPDAAARQVITKGQGYVLIGLLCVALLLSLWASFKPQPKYEYKVVSFLTEGNARDGDGALKFSSVRLDEGELSSLGADGWELVGTYLEMETAFPNFGKSEYVTGLQPNVRPQKAVLIFRRQK